MNIKYCIQLIHHLSKSGVFFVMENIDLFFVVL